MVLCQLDLKRDNDRPIDIDETEIETGNWKEKVGRDRDRDRIRSNRLIFHDLISKSSNCGNEGVNFLWKLLDKPFFLVFFLSFFVFPWLTFGKETWNLSGNENNFREKLMKTWSTSAHVSCLMSVHPVRDKDDGRKHCPCEIIRIAFLPSFGTREVSWRWAKTKR